MVKITLLHGDKLGQMDHIQSQIVDLTIADARQATADGATSQYNGKSSSNVNSEGNDRENGNISGENLVSEASQGIRPVTNDESRRRSSESDDDSEEDSSEDEEIKAPLELLGEFLQCVRTSDWENASKLCKMILIYEPDNQLALQFQPVIEEKSQIEKELAEMSSSSDEEYSTDEETSDEESEAEECEDADNEKDQDDDEFDEPTRPTSTIKNPLIFPHHDPVWKP